MWVMRGKVELRNIQGLRRINYTPIDRPKTKTKLERDRR